MTQTGFLGPIGQIASKSMPHPGSVWFYHPSAQAWGWSPHQQTWQERVFPGSWGFDLPHSWESL